MAANAGRRDRRRVAGRCVELGGAPPGSTFSRSRGLIQVTMMEKTANGAHMDWLRAGASRREFERFVTDRTGPLLRTAYLMAGNLHEAEDLVQETMLRVARHWPRVRVMKYPAAYARQTLVNLALDGAAQRARRTGELTAAESAATWEPTDIRAQRALYEVDTREELRGALAALPARQRAFIVLRYWEDLPEAEVAEILGCSVGTVKSSASRGLARLRATIRDDASGYRTPLMTPRNTAAPN
jgi:RNA polymerase sigma-70 factor (sigma-E family)